jgi:2-methylisocitrate lyase-like PEP mutase family enzyme
MKSKMVNVLSTILVCCALFMQGAGWWALVILPWGFAQYLEGRADGARDTIEAMREQLARMRKAFDTFKSASNQEE